MSLVHHPFHVSLVFCATLASVVFYATMHFFRVECSSKNAIFNGVMASP
jgi:hypothetical protein